MRLTLRTAIAAGAVTAVVAPVAGVAAGASATTTTGRDRLHLLSAATRFHAAESNNWFGYNQGALSHSRYTSITGNWTVPTATQHSTGQDEYSSTWIGIGGGCIDDGCGTGVTDETLIQAGTEQDVAADGTASYNAWWEIIPEPETAVSLPVHPGDQIHVAIAESTPGLWSIEIDNVSTGQNFSTTTPYPGLGGSAEWIEETPLLLGTNAGFGALPNLTPVQFSGATVNGANAGLDSSQEMDLVDNSGTVYAAPSAPNATRDGFTACTWTATCQ